MIFMCRNPKTDQESAIKVAKLFKFCDFASFQNDPHPKQIETDRKLGAFQIPRPTWASPDPESLVESSSQKLGVSKDVHPIYANFNGQHHEISIGINHRNEELNIYTT
jgi:hypothetical protein